MPHPASPSYRSRPYNPTFGIEVRELQLSLEAMQNELKQRRLIIVEEMLRAEIKERDGKDPTVAKIEKHGTCFHWNSMTAVGMQYNWKGKIAVQVIYGEGELRITRFNARGMALTQSPEFESAEGYGNPQQHSEAPSDRAQHPDQ